MEDSWRKGNIQYEGQEYNWTRDLPREAKVPLFSAFKAGESIKKFLVSPEDKSGTARLIARLERENEGSNPYTDAHLEELGLTRKSIEDAQAEKDKAQAMRNSFGAKPATK